MAKPAPPTNRPHPGATPARRRSRPADYALKWRRVVPAAALAAWGAVWLLRGARRLFDLRWGLLSESEWWELFFPLGLAALVVLAVLRRPFASLADPPGSRASDGCRWFCWMMITAMLVASQMRQSRTQLCDRDIASIDAVGTPDPHVRYRPGEASVLPRPLCGAVDYRSSRHDIHVTMSFLLPFDNVRGAYLYGVEIDRTASRRLSDEEFARQVETYYTMALQQLREGRTQTTGYFRTPASGRAQARFRKALDGAGLSDEQQRGIVVLMAAEPPRPVRRFGAVWIAFLAGMALLHLLLLFPRYRADRPAAARRPGHRRRAWREGLASFGRRFLAAQPLSTLLAATLALSLGVLLFGTASLLTSPTSGELLAWGAMRRAEVAAGDWWRPLTAILLHGSWTHLLCNCMSGTAALLCSLSLFGSTWRIGTLYLLSGLAGSLTSLAFHPDNVCIGASGAIMGLLGATLTAGLLFRRNAGSMIAWAAVTAGLTLVAGMGVGIDNAAHAGGFVAGAVLGPLLYRREPSAHDRRPVS